MIALLSLLQEAAPTEFNDLGKLLLGGMAAAVVVAVGLILLKLKLEEKRPPASKFISISSPPNDKAE